MKKKLNGRFLHWGNRTSKLSKIMRISFVLLVAVFMQVSAASYSQSQKVSLKAGKVSLPELFKMIQEQSDFDFFYQPEAVSETKNVSLNGEQVEIEEVLNEALRGTGLEYKIIDTDIVILPKKEVAKTESRILTAQQTTGKITGTIVDMTGEPIPGVSVMIKGTTTGTITNIEGVYELNNIAEDAVIVYSFIGFTTQEVNVAGRSAINITLAEEMTGLDEVVVVGYGSMERKQITSAVASLNTEDLPTVSASSPVQQLQGRVAGLSVSTPNGSDPNASPELLIRGMGSIGGGQPMIIVDGVVVGSLDVVAAEDIETFSVLKDGSAAAIYGSRGTNGVILITTKSGKDGKSTFEYSGYYSINQVTKKPDVLSADEFRSFAQEKGIDPSLLGSASTNWYDELLQSSHNIVHNLSVSGGNQQSNYRASIDFTDNQGVALESFKKRINGRINVNHKAIKDRLEIKASLAASQSDYRPADHGAFGAALRVDPTLPVKNEDGSYSSFDKFGVNNPVASVMHYTSDNRHKIVLANAKFDFEIIDGLKAGGRVAWKIEDRNSGTYTSSENESLQDKGIDGKAKVETFWSYRYTYEGNLTYRKRIGKHDFSAMVNHTTEKDTWYTYTMENSEFVNDKFSYHGIGNGMALSDPSLGFPVEMKTKRFRKELQSYRGRLVYSFNDRYMTTLSYNREGSTLFGADHKWGDFYGVSLGWTISEEDFMQNLDIINYLKLRVGYGETGNQATGPYNSLSRVGAEGLPYVYNGQSVKAYGLLNNPNPGLKWETKAETNIGVDYALLNNRIDGSFDVYQRVTSDLLFDVKVPLPALLNPNMESNVGEITNKGFEFAINAKVISNSDFKWSVGFNGSYNENKIDKLSYLGMEAVPIYYAGLPGNGLGSAYIIQPGGSVADFYGKRFDRINENGEWEFKDLNDKEEGFHDETDREVIGNGIPKFQAGLTNRVEYKGFDLEVFMRGAFDFQVLNVGRMYLANPDIFPGSNVYQEATTSPLRTAPQYSDYYIENGDYWKIENIALGYNFDVSKIDYLSFARLYVSCSNVYTFTNYSGLSPENKSNNVDEKYNGAMRSGFDDMNFYPITRTFTLGAILKF